MTPMLLDPVRPVARKKLIPTVQVRIARDVAETATIVAAYRRTQASDLLTEILRPILTQMHAEEVRRAAVPGTRPDPSPSPGRPASRRRDKS